MEKRRKRFSLETLQARLALSGWWLVYPRVRRETFAAGLLPPAAVLNTGPKQASAGVLTWRPRPDSSPRLAGAGVACRRERQGLLVPEPREKRLERAPAAFTARRGRRERGLCRLAADFRLEAGAARLGPALAAQRPAGPATAKKAGIHAHSLISACCRRRSSCFVDQSLKRRHPLCGRGGCVVETGKDIRACDRGAFPAQVFDAVTAGKHAEELIDEGRASR